MNTLHPSGSYSFILGSASPRRMELLKALGFDFQVMVRPVNEDELPDIPVEEVAEWLARTKALAFQDVLTSQPNNLVITADTVVWKGHAMYGKPGNRTQAIQMLMELQGTTHQVSTAVCLAHASGFQSFTDTAAVKVRPLSQLEIEHYVDQAKPFDKAGGYGIQEWFGMACIERIEGNFYTIMGLPTVPLFTALNQFKPVS